MPLSPAVHRMPAAVFSALARGGGGPDAMHLLRSTRRSRTLGLVMTLVRLADQTGHPEAAIARDAYVTLADVQQVAPHAVERVLDYPLVSAWATRTVLLLRRGATPLARPGHLAAVVAAAAVRGGHPLTIRLAGNPAGQLVSLPSLGAIRVPHPHDQLWLRSHGDGAELVAGRTLTPIPVDPHRNESWWRGLPKIAVHSGDHSTSFLVDGWVGDTLVSQLADRYALSSPVQLTRWQDRIAQGWDLLVCEHTAAAQEVAAMITVLTPLPTTPYGLASATPRDAFGCVFLSLPPDARSVAVTLVHELQHTKLCALMDLFALLHPGTAHPGTGEKFYAPWRDDPRPPYGLLHGAYAYLGVTAFWRWQRYVEQGPAAQRAHAEYARWRRAVRDVAHVLLTSGRLTSTGRSFVIGITDALGEWENDPVPGDALELAGQLAAEHRARWSAEHLANG